MDPHEALVIDCDCGVDDAEALLLALRRKANVIGITCVAGNTALENVTSNVLRLLKVANRTDIPVYVGAAEPLMGSAGKKHAIKFHGDDGFGNISHEISVDTSLLSAETAFSALSRLSREKTISVIALGPLTNLAITAKMDPTFSKRLKSLHIMGSSMYAKGNHTFATSEFNFGFDPEAAALVIAEFECPLTIFPWETCVEHPVPWVMNMNENIMAKNELLAVDRGFVNIALTSFTRRRIGEYFERQGVDRAYIEEWYHKWIDAGTELSHFYKRLTHHCMKHRSRVTGGYYSCDLQATAAALDSNIVSESITIACVVETRGKFTNGQVVLDWYGHFTHATNRSTPTFITKIDVAKFAHVLDTMFRD